MKTTTSLKVSYKIVAGVTALLLSLAGVWSVAMAEEVNTDALEVPDEVVVVEQTEIDVSSTDTGVFIFADEETTEPASDEPEEQTAEVLEIEASPSVVDDQSTTSEQTETVSEETTQEAAVIEALSAPELSTDKDDYHPGQTATIFGKFFAPLQNFVLKIFGSDENDDNYTEQTETVTTDEDGSFSFNYLLDSLYRPFYRMVASTEDGETVAESYFRDSSIGTYDQCSNDLGTGYVSGDTGCRWTNGNIQSNNSKYFEGDATVQRLWIEGYAPGSKHTVTFKYGTTKAGKHAYDYLTTWNASENWVTVADRCQDITGCTTAAESQTAMQNDPNATDTIEPAAAGRKFTIRGGTIASSTIPTIVSGTYAGDSETTVTVNFTVANSGDMCTTKSNITSCGIAIWFGAHVANGSEWTIFNNTTGAGSINGAPYHVALDKEDGTSVGQRDNQMQSAAVLPPAATGVITIIKNTVPDDAQDFVFTTTGTGLNNFSLDDDANGTLSNTQTFSALADGTYSVTESASAGFDLTGLVCTDLTGGTVINLGTRNASINLSGGETVTCTYTNTKRGSLTIVKNAVGGNDTFNFTGNTGVSTLTTVAGTAQQTVANILPGTYNIAETVPTGWSLTSATCDSGETIGSIDVGPGENVTCTFTNTKNATLTLVKTVENNNGGTATASDFQGKIDGNNVAWSTPISVSVGTHTASETTLPTYTASVWGGNCAANGTVTLAAGENKTCSVTNSDNAPILHLRKVVTNNNGGTAIVADFTLTANGTGANDLSGTSPVDSGAGLLADTFALSETSLPGYTASNWVCVGGTQNGASITLGLGQEATCTITNDDQQAFIIVDKTVVNDNGGTAVADDFLLKVDGNAVSDSVAYAVNPGPHKASETLLAGYSAGDWGTACDADGDVTVALGETKTCTITNTDNAPKLTLNKILVKDNGGVATEADWTLTATGPTTLSGAGAAGDTDVVSGASFDAGVYTLSESAGPAGYAATGWTCSNGDNDGTISVALGDDITCSITNNDNTPSLTLVKVVENDNGGTATPANFTLTATGATGFSGAGPQVENGASFDAGAYNLSEAGPAGYTDSEWICVGGTQSDGDTVTLGLGESATCTITNTDNTPSLTLVKEVTNDDGGNAVAANWTLTATGPTSINGAGGVVSGSSFDAGVYALSESTGPAGYTAGLWSCTGTGTQDGASIALDLGESAVCTIVNNDQPGTLIVHKVTDPASDTTTQFTITAAKDVTGFVEGTAQQTIAGGETETYTVHAGVYDVTEAPLAGWNETGNTCVDVAIANGETKHCTITNTKKGHLIVQKTTLPALDATSFTINASGNGTITGGGTGSITDAADKDYEVTPGTYSVLETVPVGWDKTGDTCQDVSVAAGETKTCTITNTKRGHVIIEKNAVPDSNTQAFTFNNNFGNGNPATFALTDTTAVGLPNYNAEVIPGKYVVTEDPVVGWQLDGTTCSSGETLADLDVEPGETVTCTVTNEKLAKIILVKNTLGGNATFDFAMTGAGLPATDSITTVANTGSDSYDNLNPDLTFSIAETPIPAGWEQTTSATCDNGDLVTAITPNAGEVITCTFTNGKLPTLTLEKVLPNDNGGIATVEDFQASIDGGNVVWGEANMLPIGEHDADETTLPGYVPSGWTGEGCSPDGGVDLAYGDNVICSITNNDIAPTLKLVKNVEIDNGGNEGPEEWQLTAAGEAGFTDAGDSTTFHTVKAGVRYTLSESEIDGYEAGDWSCDSDIIVTNSQITLDLNQNVTCTITNDDIAPSITLIKVLNKQYGALEKVEDFELTVGGDVVLSGDPLPVLANVSYALDEADVSGWVFESLTGEGCPSDLGGTVMLDEGEHITCTITNKDLPAKISGYKFNDLNANGVWDEDGGEAGLEGWEINLNVDEDSILTNEDGYYEFTDLSQGSYALSETLEDAWAQTLPLDNQLAVSVGNGEHAEDNNFGNVKLGKIIIQKTLVSENEDSDDVTFSFETDFDGSYTLVGGASEESVLLLPGTYSASEIDIPEGFNLTDIACDDQNSIENIPTGSASITLESDETVTCLFTNTEESKIVVDKITIPADDEQSFAFITQGSGYDGFSLADASLPNTQTLVAGTYEVAEDAIAGWDITGMTCTSSLADKESVEALSLQAGEIITCTFTNTKKGHLVVDKVTLPTGDPTSFAISATGGTVTGGSAGNVTDAVNKDYEVTPGTYDVTETVPVGWDQTSNTCVDVVVAAGQTETCTITNTKRATVTIVKDAQPDDAQNFVFGGSFGAFTLDDDTGVVDADLPNAFSSTVTFNSVIPGAKSITETQPNQYWKLKSASCVLTGTATAVASSLVGGTLSVTAAPGANLTCTFVNEKLDPTRTQGFWQTHTTYTSAKFAQFFGAGMTIGTPLRKTVVTTGHLFGAWYSNIAKLSNGKTQRSALDKARMQLLQQLVTAKLNCATFGCSAGVQTMIANADIAYSGTSAGAIITSAGLVDAYNNSGDSVAIGNAGKATPQTSQSIANKGFWDIP